MLRTPLESLQGNPPPRRTDAVEHPKRRDPLRLEPTIVSLVSHAACSATHRHVRPSVSTRFEVLISKQLRSLWDELIQP